MCWRVWGLNSTIISSYLLLDTAHSLAATYWRCVDAITESKHTRAACSGRKTHTHTHTYTLLLSNIPWCHRSYFTNNGPHVCWGLQGCVRQGDWAQSPVWNPVKITVNFLLVFSSCNLRARCGGDWGQSQINSLLYISFPCILWYMDNPSTTLLGKKIFFLHIIWNWWVV